LGNYSLFFIDGHTDFMWPELSSSHGAAGMDLAIVTGNAHDKLANIENAGPYFREDQVWCVGNREFDKNYVSAIKNSDIHYYDLDKLREEGIKKTVNMFFASLSADEPDGFWIHLDVDVLDPQIMPAVDSPDPGGLSYTELISLLEDLLTHPLCTGLEITILDPDLDPGGKVVREFIFHIGNTIKRAVG
jgi:arginase